MPFNGSGVYEPIDPPDFPAVPLTTIRSAQYNNQINDIAAALSLCLVRTGESAMLADLDMGGNQLENLADPTAAGQALVFASDASVEDLTVTGNAQIEVTARNSSLIDNDLSFDLAARNNFKSTPTAAGVLTFTNLADGQSGTVLLINTANYAIAKHVAILSDPTFTATISFSGVYRISYFCDGTNVFCSTTGGLS